MEYHYQKEKALWLWRYAGYADERLQCVPGVQPVRTTRSRLLSNVSLHGNPSEGFRGEHGSTDKDIFQYILLRISPYSF